MLRIGPISLSLYCIMLKMEKQNACNHDIILFPKIHNAPFGTKQKKPSILAGFFGQGWARDFRTYYIESSRLSLLT